MSNHLPEDVRDAIRRSLAGIRSGETVVLSKITQAVRDSCRRSSIDGEELEDAIVEEAMHLQLGVDFDTNAHRH